MIGGMNARSRIPAPAFAIGALAAALALLAPLAASAQEASQDILERAVVTAIVSQGTQATPGTDTIEQVQTITVQAIDGPDKDMSFTFENDFTQLSVGDEFYLRHVHNDGDGATDTYSMADPYRLPLLGWFAAAFVLAVVAFGGWQGVRALATLAGSLALIGFALLPGIIAGYSPVLVSVGVAALIIVLGSYITHGFNRTTSAAVIGMVATVALTGALAWYAVDAGQLSGYYTEASTYLHFQYNGTINLVGLLLGGILIGLLGVLYDMAIGQAVAVEELLATDGMTPQRAFSRALRIGREHIGALVNTLAIAYVGASLPLLLLFHDSGAPLGYVVNGEVIATEIVRILVASLGVVLAMPITTAAAVLMLAPRGSIGLPWRRAPRG
jgi:uncharacterized membrane protein